MESKAIARAVVLRWYHGPYNIHNFDQTRADIEIADVARAIDAAVAAERERCAETIGRHARWQGGYEEALAALALPPSNA